MTVPILFLPLPNVYIKYACSPPDRGILVPSSAYAKAPVTEVGKETIQKLQTDFVRYVQSDSIYK